jgi:uncharacterized protein involved in response to NO
MQFLNKLTLFQLAFRPFFILSAFYAIWLLLRWTLTLSGVWAWQSDIGLFAWHAHEFQFGFAMAVVLGFILTAAQTWTGQPGIKGAPLIVLVSLWLIARIGMNVNNGALIGLIADSGVLLVSIFWLARMLVRSQNKRNFIFIALFLGFLVLNCYQFYAIFEKNSLLSTRLNFATSWWFVLLISFMSSRVIPFFISKGTDTEINREPLAFTIVCQLMILAIFIVCLIDTSQDLQFTQNVNNVKYTLYGFSLVCHLYRLYLWYTPAIWKNALLWSLWVNYSFLPLAFIALLSFDNYSSAMHLVNVGFIGAMILTFTARVSLGHTGRNIVASPIVVIALTALVIATLVRGFGAELLPAYSAQFTSISAISWIVGLCCFLYYYLPILCKPRLDGKEG